uniref:AB hydrolase-1 domain-containing protein n=1 Tax=Oryza barthii TaxID=65489 RepID=A0A0D3HQQ5_9ORYZ
MPLPRYLQSPPSAPHPQHSAAFSRGLRPRRPNGPPPAFASAEFPGSVPDSAQMPPRRRRRRVAGIDRDDLLDPDALADPDSSFYEINGVRVHHKVCTHEDSSDQSPDPAITNADQNQIVLVVSGDTDRLVPRWNTERVARVIPGAAFEVIKNSGHLPQEERPEEFISVVERFLRKAFGRPSEQEKLFQAV